MADELVDIAALQAETADIHLDESADFEPRAAVPQRGAGASEPDPLASEFETLSRRYAASSAEGRRLAQELREERERREAAELEAQQAWEAMAESATSNGNGNGAVHDEEPRAPIPRRTPRDIPLEDGILRQHLGADWDRLRPKALHMLDHYGPVFEGFVDRIASEGAEGAATWLAWMAAHQERLSGPHRRLVAIESAHAAIPSGLYVSRRADLAPDARQLAALKARAKAPHANATAREAYAKAAIKGRIAHPDLDHAEGKRDSGTIPVS